MICTSVSLRASTRVSSGFAPLRHSSPSFGSRQACSHSNPSQKIKVGRRCTREGSRQSASLRLTGRRPEHAGAEARQDGTCWVPRSRRRRLHGRIEGPGLGRHHDPHRSTPRADRRTGSRRSTSDRGASPAPIRFPPDNFKHSLTLFSKSFSSFPRGTCSLSVSRPYLALDGIYRPIRAAFPNNPTRRQRLVVRQGPGTTGLSPSPTPLSRGLGPGPPLTTLLHTTIRTPRATDSQAGLFPVRSPLLRESLPPDQSQPHPRAQSGVDRMEQIRADPGSQSGAHQVDRIEQTRAHQGAQSCAHHGAKSGRHPEAQDLENAREPDHIRLAEKAGDKLTMGESCLIGLVLCSLCCADLGGYTSHSSYSIFRIQLSLKGFFKCLVSFSPHKTWGKADLGDSSSKQRLEATRTSQGGSRGVTSWLIQAFHRGRKRLRPHGWARSQEIESTPVTSDDIIDELTSLEERVGKLKASEEEAKETQGVFESRLVNVEILRDQFKDVTRRFLDELDSVRESNAGEAEVKALRIEVDELKKELLSCKAAMSEWEELKPFLEELRPSARLVMEQGDARSSEAQVVAEEPTKPTRSEPSSSTSKDDGKGGAKFGPKKEASRRLKCYFCDGPHIIRGCTEKNRLAAIVKRLDDPEGGVARLGVEPREIHGATRGVKPRRNRGKTAHGKAVKPKVGQLKCHRCKGPHKLRECPSRATTSKAMNEPEIEKAVEVGSMVSDGLDMSGKAAGKLAEDTQERSMLVETATISWSKEVRGLAEDAHKGSMPSKTASRERSKEVEPKRDTTTEDTPLMGKVGNKPRTSKRKCRRGKRKQRTSGKKGQCDRVNAPKAEERVHVAVKNIKEDGSVPRVPGFADVEEPTRVNATEGKVHLKNNSCAFEFDLPSSSSVGRNRPNFLCGGNKAWVGPFRVLGSQGVLTNLRAGQVFNVVTTKTLPRGQECPSYGHDYRSEGKSNQPRLGDVADNITWQKKSKRATSVQAETSGVHQADVPSYAEDRSFTWRKEPRQVAKAESSSFQDDLTHDRRSQSTRASTTLVGENVTTRTDGAETVAQVPDNGVFHGASGLPRPPDQSQPHPRAQSGVHRMEQIRADPGSQSDAHQVDRMEQTRAHQGAQSCAHHGAKSGRHPEAQDLENAREPDHIRLAEKAGDKLTMGESCLIGLVLCSLCCADLGGYTSHSSYSIFRIQLSLKGFFKCLVSFSPHKTWGKADLGDSSSK
ncbi:hypothetical protein V6N11_082118 [Hibiscus sabdariffa]|uniref:Uncharacterized protein n=1 Tax=Hibiscus sabdariffa TaxID=183260 RepID=A0ABR2QGZ4_9ROSI